MKRTATVQEHRELLSNLQALPRKMLSMYTSDTIPELVLHELCHENCFNIHKAAYFVDNPDFDCFKGIAGINHHEEMIKDDVWNNVDQFSRHMGASPFNQKVKSILHQSAHKKHLQEHDLTKLLSQELEIENPRLFRWNMKHDNHGVLIIDQHADNRILDENYLVNSIHLLGFCPVH